MISELTDTLCTRCGLCCDGALFGDVELSGTAEATSLEIMGLAIDLDEEAVLLQPCTALEGTRCRIYDYRPSCCRAFECRLLQGVRQGNIDVDQAGKTIAETRRLVVRLDALCRQMGAVDARLPLKERCMEVLAASDCDDDARRQVRDELTEAMEAMARFVREVFLGRETGE